MAPMDHILESAMGMQAYAIVKTRTTASDLTDYRPLYGAVFKL